MNFETILTVFMKKYLIATLATLFGALVHSFETIKNNGWKGWFPFIYDMSACSFTGFTFFHLAQIVLPGSQQALIIFTSVGSYWGTKGFVFAREWVINSIKANIK